MKGMVIIMKKIRKVLSVILLIAMVISLFGCGKHQDSHNGKINLTWFTVNSFMPEDGVSEIMKVAAEKTGVELKCNVSKNMTDYEQAFSVMLASNELTDVISLPGSEADKYGSSGALQPLNELIDKYAPNIKAFLEKNSNLRKEITSMDGKIYYLPFIYDTDAMKVSTVWYIRQDWLDKLGLKKPNNVSELHDVLLAFKENDPNGNGIKDEFGFFSRAMDPCELLVLWDAKPDYYIEDNVVKYGPAQPEYKEAVKNIAKWYKEGLIDPEIYTRINSRDVALSRNIGGCCLDWAGSTAQYNDTLKDVIPGFELDWMLPPVNSAGKILNYASRDQNYGNGWAISISNKYPEETIKFFDYWFTEEGSILANYGIEGKDYEMVDGQPKFKDELLHADKPLLDILRNSGAQWTEMSYVQDFNYEKQWLPEKAKQAMETYQNQVEFVKRYPSINLSEEEKEKINSADTDIKYRLKEVTQQWILGQMDVETTYDSVLKEFKQFGLDEAVKMRQQAYDRYINAK